MIELVICLMALIVGFVVSALIVLWTSGLLTPAEKRRRDRVAQEIKIAWRQVELAWQRRRWKRLLAAGWHTWRAYARWKRLSWIGALDLALIHALTLVSVAAVGVDVWDVLMTLIDWWRSRGSTAM